MKNLLYILIVAVFFSCEDPIDIDHPQGEVRYSVEGEITTVNKIGRVFVTSSAQYDETEIPKIEGAKVTLFKNNVILSTYEDRGEGVYLSKDSIKGEVGQSYHIEVELSNGTLLKSYPEKIKIVTAIDSIYSKHVSDYIYDNGPPREIDNEETGYYVFLNTTENVGKGDAYRWKVYINDDLLDDPEQLFFYDDFGVDGTNIEQLDFNFLANLGDEVRIEQTSISKRNYDYLFSLLNEALPSGGFGTPPAPVIGNIYDMNNSENTVFGYFTASDVSSATIKIVGSKK